MTEDLRRRPLCSIETAGAFYGHQSAPLLKHEIFVIYLQSESILASNEKLGKTMNIEQ